MKAVQESCLEDLPLVMLTVKLVNYQELMLLMSNIFTDYNYNYM